MTIDPNMRLAKDVVLREGMTPERIKGEKLHVRARSTVKDEAAGRARGVTLGCGDSSPLSWASRSGVSLEDLSDDGTFRKVRI